MTEILLTSETFIKDILNISDNTAGKFILPSIREAQNIALRQILGSCLLAKLCTLVGAEEIDDQGNEAYADLVEELQYFLGYSAVVELIPRVSYKIGNFGMAKSNDENLYVAADGEIQRQIYFYQSKADAYGLKLQQWILDNRASFPELSECSCREMKAHLDDAASCGIFLGGARGRITSKGRCCRK